MTNFNWYSAVDGDWNNLADWDQFEVPQAADDVTIDLPAATSPYTVTIASSESKAVNSVILDDVSNDQGTLAIDGTLAVTGTVSSDGGLFNLQGGTIAATELDISAGTNGGFVQGYGTIASDVVNNATLSAVGGTLVVTGALTGTGQVIFDFDATQASYTNSSETLQVGTVSAGQTITTNGNDTLVLTTPGAFAGTIWAQAGDQIVLLGDTVGNATDTNGTLVVTDTSNNVLADLALTGDYNGDIFTVNGSTITIVSSVVPPTISGTMSNQSMTSAQTITPFTGVTIGDQNVNQTETVTVTLSAAGNGTLSNLGGGSYDPVGGVYTDVGSAATVTSDLDGLVFTPTVTGTLGATATTTFTISDIDTAVQVASDSNTTVNVTVVAQAYSWTSAISDDWSNAADWTPNGVPGATADVTIDQAAGLGNYTVTIGSGESEVVNSIALNDVSNSDGTLAINGTLTFAAGSPGTITGPAQNYITMDGGTLVNAAEVDGLLQTQGDVLITGTNAVNVANWLQDLSGTVTIDTSSIYNVYGSLLSGGTFEATPGATIDLGGTLEGAMVAIGTITQGLGVPTEVILDDNGTIDQWNGSAYVPLQDTLTEIDTGGTLDVLQGGGFVSGNTLSIDGGLLNLQAGTIAPAELDINSGVVQGYAEIASNVVNNSTLTALGGTLIVDGTLSGTGVVQFDIDTQAGTTASTGSTLEVGSVASGQTITMNGTDTLVLTTPGVFDGTIAAQVGDQIVLQGDDLGVASYIGGDLYVYDTGFNELANLTLAGDYSNDTFMVSGSTITVAATTPPAAPPSQPTISGMTSDQTTTSGQVITPFNGVSIADTNVDQTETLTVTLSDQSDGILSGFSTGTYDVSSGTYSDTGSLSQINGDLAALVFTPAVIGTIGAMTTTTFTISDTDTAAQTVTDSTTSVIATTAEQAYSWSTAASDDWSNAFDWTPQAVPGAAADVTIDETVATNAYVVTIGTNEAEIVNTLTLNDVNNLLGTLAINGTLTFTPGASGDIVGPATSVITMNNGTLVNVGTVDGLISATGNVLLTGTNGFYDSSLIQESAGTLTIDTPSIDTISVNILQSGLFESYLSDAVIDLGGPLAGDDANIATIAGPNGPTEITLVGNGAFNTWNGSSYSALQDTLTEIDAGGTLDVLQGGSYVSSNTLLVNGGLLNLGAATISVAELDIAAGGIVLGNATIASDVVNNSTLSAIGGTLIIGGTLSGSGLVQFDLNGSFSDPTGAVLQVGAVSEGQTFYMNGRDTLVLSAPDLFAGTIAALAGDQIVLLGDTIGGATDTNGTLFVTDTSDNLLASLALSGDAGETFTANGSAIDVGTFYFQPTITGTNGDQAITSVQTITPFSGVTVSDQNANQLEDLTVTLTVPANGTLSNLGAGFYDPTMGIYTDNNESAAQISADLNGLVFTPTATGTLGATFTTGFNIVVIDSADQTAADSTTTVTETIVPPVYDWITGTSGYWGTAANWAQNNAPNGTDDVTIDAPATNGVYTAYIAGDESEVVNSLTLNAVNNYSGVSAPVYTAAELEIDGTLTFASGSAGTIAGPVQSLIDMNGGTLVNAGSVSAIIQTQNTVLITGTNDLTIAGGVIDTFGTVTIDTASLGIVYGDFLVGGTFQAASSFSVIDLGGTLCDNTMASSLSGPRNRPSSSWTTTGR